MEILCRRCDGPALGNYDSELLCLGCMAGEIERDRAARTPLAAARIVSPSRAA
jgi:hypothetical protein